MRHSAVQLCALVLAIAAGCKEGGEDKEGSDEEQAADSPGEPAASASDGGGEASALATLGEAHGAVEIRRQGSESWEEAASGARLGVGDRIRTGDLAFARVELRDGRDLELQEETEIQVREEGEGGISVGLERGLVQGKLTPPDPGSGEGGADKLLLRAGDDPPAELARATGETTSFRLRRVGEETEVAVQEGRLRVSSEEGSRRIGGGEAVGVRRGKVGKPVKLLGFPDQTGPGVDARFHCTEGLAIELVWNPLDGATGYRVQVARDLSFRQLAASSDTEETAYTFKPTEPGTYPWRVASRGRGGRLGEYGFARRLFCESEEPGDLLLAPKAGARFSYLNDPPAVKLSWQSAGETRSYRVVVARGEGLRDDVVLDETTELQTHLVTGLEEGTYTWGVYALLDTPRPIFLEPRQFTIRQRSAPQAHTEDLWD